ncbi:hypothetical protein [Persephonella sp.]
MKDKLYLLFYTCSVITFTTIHSISFFILSILILFILSGKDIIKITKKAVLSILIFNSVISASYFVISVFRDDYNFDYILLINLRVFAITYLTFLFVHKVNLFRMFSFSKTLTFLLILSYSQILIFKKYFSDFQMALKSRMINKPTKKDRYNFISSVIYFFMNKSVKNSQEIAQAMKSRGFFID